MPLVLATLRAYPREELSISAAHFWEQLITFGLWDYGPNAWVEEMFDKVLPGARLRYLRTRQVRRALPDDFSSSAQEWTVIASLVLIGAFAPFVFRRRPARLIGLSVVVIFVIIANAFVTGVFANVEDRYQSRVIWLLPLLAMLFAIEWLDHRRSMRPHRPCKSPFLTG
jgi:small-conductance mechanosensitive channel